MLRFLVSVLFPRFAAGDASTGPVVFESWAFPHTVRAQWVRPHIVRPHLVQQGHTESTDPVYDTLR